jgi:peroxiredoxin
MKNILQSGYSAPTFETLDLSGRRIALEDYRNDKVLLSFYRNSACALCNLRIHQLMENAHRWNGKGLIILSVFESPAESMREYVGRLGPPFPLIPDPQAQLYDMYGVEVSEEKVQRTINDPCTKSVVSEAAEKGFVLTKEPDTNMNRIPADFLISPGLTIHTAHYCDLVYDHLPLGAIDDFVHG